jgi:ATP-dependent Lhr-like helicase
MAQEVVAALRDRGASFFEDLLASTRLLRPQLEDALAQLVTLGLVTSDGFSGLRALLTPSEKRPGGASGRRRRGAGVFGMESAGRWNLLPGATLPAETPTAEAPEASPRRSAPCQRTRRRSAAAPRRPRASAAAKRGPRAVAADPRPRPHRDDRARAAGAVGGSSSAPSWSGKGICLRGASCCAPCAVSRRVGEIRGGRFVDGFTGEQFALPEAVAALRAVRRRDPTGALVAVSGADPLNLGGIVLPGDRLPALAGNRVLYRDGVPIAVRERGEVRFLVELDPPAAWQARNALLQRRLHPGLKLTLGRSA